MSTAQTLKHMMPNDIPLWASYFFTPEGQSFHQWEFDAITGDPEDPGAYYPPAARRQALYLNSLKIDAIGWIYDTPTLIECKPIGNLGAVGQINGYRIWYQIHFAYLPQGVLVCQQMSRQVQIYCDLTGIAYRIVQPADPATVNNAINLVRPKICDRSCPRYLIPVR